MMLKILLSSALVFCGALAKADDTHDIGFSVNLNSALLAVIQHGKAALGNTGCIIIDSFFNNNLQVDQSGLHTYYNVRISLWESDEIKSECRRYKEDYYMGKFGKGWKCDPSWGWDAYGDRCERERNNFLVYLTPKGPYTWKPFKDHIDYECTDSQRHVVIRMHLKTIFGYLEPKDDPAFFCKPTGVCHRKVPPKVSSADLGFVTITQSEYQ